MRKLLYAAAAFVLLNSLVVSAATRQETYSYYGKPASPAPDAMYGERVNIAIISDNGDHWALECYGAGETVCSWFDAGCPSCDESFDPYDPNSLYVLGDVATLIQYAETQIENGTGSGTHHANITVGTTIYYRTVTWDYTATTGERDCTVTITEVTP